MKALIEILDFLIVICIVFLAWVGVMYGQAIYVSVNDLLVGTQTFELQEYRQAGTPLLAANVSQRTEELVDQLIDRVTTSNQYVRANMQQRAHSFHLDQFLTSERTREHFTFSTLPPGKRLLIPSLGVNVPIIDLAFATSRQMELGDFDKELEDGVVKYPFTADPGQFGNSVIFGHSSVEARNRSPYGFVFYRLNQLQPGERFQIIWDGQMFEYEIEHKVVKRPRDVAAELNKYQNGHYLTLMSCYPLFSDAQRLLVIAKQVNTPSSQLVMQ